MKLILKVVILSVFILTTGCGIPAKKLQSAQSVNQNEQQIQIIEPELSEKVKEVANTVKGVEESTAFVINKNISVAVKVSGFDRLRVKPIKNQVQKKVEEMNKNYKVHVTSDKKLYKQLQQIERGWQGGWLPDIQEKMNKINKDMQS